METIPNYACVGDCGGVCPGAPMKFSKIYIKKSMKITILDNFFIVLMKVFDFYKLFSNFSAKFGKKLRHALEGVRGMELPEA